MNKHEFVDVIRFNAVDSTIDGLKSILASPPGRSPHKDLVEESNWYNGLNEVDRAMVERIIRRSIESSAFSFLALLDGVSTIEAGPNKGVLKLIYEKDGKQILLNDEKDGEHYLHDLL